MEHVNTYTYLYLLSATEKSDREPRRSTTHIILVLMLLVLSLDYVRVLDLRQICSVYPLYRLRCRIRIKTPQLANLSMCTLSLLTAVSHAKDVCVRHVCRSSHE
jgi:hypothetical protein